jgi:hypothetical protein
MQEQIRALQAEAGRLRAILDGHRASGGCQNQQELEAQIAHIDSMTKVGSFYSSSRPGSAASYGSAEFASPTMGMITVNSGDPQSPYEGSMHRTNSAMSQMSNSTFNLGYKADGTPDLMSPHCPGFELKRLHKEQMARDEEYMKSLKMSRQNSNESNLSKVTELSEDLSPATSDESGYTSAITTPEGEKPKNVVPGRRGRPRKLENPRGTQQDSTVDPALRKVDGLQGLQDPAEFLAQQQ